MFIFNPSRLGWSGRIWSYLVWSGLVKIGVNSVENSTLNDNIGNKFLHQGKWWLAMVGKWWLEAEMLTSTSSQGWRCSLDLSLNSAPSLICLNQGRPIASPSCLEGGWLSVGGGMWIITSLTLASLGLQATPAGDTSPRWGDSYNPTTRMHYSSSSFSSVKKMTDDQSYQTSAGVTEFSMAF